MYGDRCRDGPFDFRTVGGPWQDPCRVHRILGLFSDLVFRVRYRTYIICLFRLRLAIGIGFGVSVPAFQCLFVECRSAPICAVRLLPPHLTSFDFGMGIGMLSAGFIATHTNLATAYGVGAVCCLLSLFVYIRLVKASHERNKLIS